MVSNFYGKEKCESFLELYDLNVKSFYPDESKYKSRMLFVNGVEKAEDIKKPVFLPGASNWEEFARRVLVKE